MCKFVHDSMCSAIVLIIKTLRLGKMSLIVQPAFSNVFSRLKIFTFWYKFHCTSFQSVQLTIRLHSVKGLFFYRLLEQQQKQLKEQQRLMQEMQYLQRQQLLQQQLSRQQQITQLTGEAGPTKLQQHLEALKKELVASGVDVDKMEAVEAMFADKGCVSFTH